MGGDTMTELLQLDDREGWWSIADACYARNGAEIAACREDVGELDESAQIVVLTAAFRRAMLAHYTGYAWVYPGSRADIDEAHRRAIAGIVAAVEESPAEPHVASEHLASLTERVGAAAATHNTSVVWAEVFDQGRSLARTDYSPPDAVARLTYAIQQPLGPAVRRALGRAWGIAHHDYAPATAALDASNPGLPIVVGWFRRDVEEVAASWPEVDLVGLRVRARHDAVALGRMCRRLEALEFPSTGPISPSPWAELGWHDRGLRPGDPDAPPV